MSTQQTDEIIIVWSEQGQRWFVVLPDSRVIDENFGAVGYALNAALKAIGAGEADFSCTEDTGTFYRYLRD